jgi:hypothetical protein
MNRSGQRTGFFLFFLAIAVAAAVGILSRRDRLPPFRPSLYLAGLNDPYRPSWIKIAGSGKSLDSIPVKDGSALRDWTALWVKLVVSNGYATTANGELSLAVVAASGEKIRTRQEWVGDNLYLLVLKGYRRAPERASLVVSKGFRILAMLPMPPLPPAAPAPTPHLGPAWSTLRVQKCERPPIVDAFGQVAKSSDVARLGAPANAFALSVQAGVPVGHIMVAQLLGTSAEPPDRPFGVVVRDNSHPAEEAAIFTPPHVPWDGAQKCYYRFTELAPTQTEVHLTFSSAGAVTRFGETWFPRYLNGAAKGSKWKYRLMAADLIPARKPPSRRPLIRFILYTASDTHPGSSVELPDRQLVGRTKVVGIRPSRFGDQWIGIVDGIRACNGMPSGLYPEGGDSTPRPAAELLSPTTEDGRRFGGPPGTIGDPILIDLQMEVYRVVRSTVSAVDLSGPVRPLPKRYFLADLVSGPSY